MYYVYVIKSINNNWYYVGSSGNLKNRLAQHNQGKVKSTQSRRPYMIIYTESYSTINSARSREKEIKSKRILKEKIIRNYTALSSNG